MALPTLDSVFASAADLPRRQMLAKWLVEEKEEVAIAASVLVSGAWLEEVNGVYTERGEFNGKPYYNLAGEESDTNLHSIVWDNDEWRIVLEDVFYLSTSDTTFPWQVTNWQIYNGEEPAPTVTEIPAANPIADYWTLPERHLWAKIAVAAGAPRGEADYISLPKNYVWSDIYNVVAGLIPPSSVLVSGAGNESSNGIYALDGQENGKNKYVFGSNSIMWAASNWELNDNSFGDITYSSSDDVEFPWQAAFITLNGDEPAPTVTEIPQLGTNHTDWTEKQALGHIAAAYRGDTGNPEALATYINWPWRYQVASIITSLLVPPAPECSDEVAQVLMTGWEYGDRTLSPIGYFPYGKETYQYGDESVRYETAVWIYENSELGVIAIAYSYADYPWLATWDSPFTSSKICP